jgi:RHS repeat-associated protein
VAFKYDGFGRRVQKAFMQGSTTTTTNYLYDGANAIEDVDQNANVLARYEQTTNIDEPLAQLRSGATSYYQADGLGSVTSLSSSTGALANTYTYDSFGKLSASTGSLTNRFQYTSREFDSETGIYFYRARYYDPTAGRFLGEDPIEFNGGINLYGYVGNNPAGVVDPSGEQQQGGTAPAPILPPATPKPPAPGPVLVPDPIPEPPELPFCLTSPWICAAGGFFLFPEPLGVGDKLPPCGKGKWHCTAKCHINNFSDQPNVPAFVTGDGWGNSIGEAQLAAEKDANTRVPKGTYKRHCSFKCEQQ